MALLRVQSSFAAAPARSRGLIQPRCVVKVSKSKSKGATVQIPKHQGKPTADPFCGYFSRWTDVQKATDDAVRDLGKTGGLTCGLDTAVVRFVGASALHALMLNNVYSSKAAVTGGAIARQERSVHEAARTAAILLHNRLNGRNMVPGLSFIDLPFSLSMTLIDILLPLGLITPGGQPVLRQQGHQPFRASADSFRKMEATFVGRWDEVFGSDDMICIPDPFPWLNADDFAQLSGFDTALMSHMISLKQRSVQHLITIVDGLIPTSFTCTASNSIILWAAQLIDKFATAFCDNSKDSNIALTTAASCNTWVCKAGRGSGPRVSGDGGSGSGVCLTAVGGGDEGEQVGQGDSCVPVIRAGMRDEEASRVSMVGRIKRVARSMGSMVGCFVCRCF